MNNKLLIILFLGMFMFSMVSAESIGTVKVGDSIEITNYCKDASCTYMNLTSITYPNGTVENINSAMTKNGQNFNYTYTPSVIGVYSFNTCGNPSGTPICDSDTFEVTVSGSGYNSSGALTYFVILFVSVFLFGLAFYGFVKLPYANQRGDDGAIIGINDLKHLKVLLMFVSYGILTWIMNIMLAITNNFVYLGISNKMFEIAFRILISMIYPLLIFTIIFIVYNYVKDFKLGKILDEGFTA